MQYCNDVYAYNILIILLQYNEYHYNKNNNCQSTKVNKLPNIPLLIFYDRSGIELFLVNQICDTC